MEKSDRNYGIDLLKVLLAIMVITIHINANGTGQVLIQATETPWKWIAMVVTILCYPAVNTYILITGYYSYDTHKNVKTVIKSLSLLWLSAVFFSLIGYLTSVIVFNGQFQLIELIKRFFPILRGVWWFYTVYFALMLLSPYINKMIDNLSEVDHKILLAILIVMQSVLPIFVDWKGQLGTNYGYSLIWFITLYISGAYLRKGSTLLDEKKKVKFGGIVYLTSSMIICILPKILYCVGIQTTFAMYNSLFVYIQSISLFTMFSNLRILNCMKKIVARLSSLALASYLLHCQEDIEKIIWNGVHPASYANGIEIVYISFAIIIVVLFISMVLEFLRKNICRVTGIDKKLVILTDNIFQRFEKLLRIKGVK